MADLRKEVFLSYQRDPRLLEAWIDEVISNLGISLKKASSLVEVEERPDSMTLGFGPQVLLALASISEGVLRVITSPEVYGGSIPPARSSHRLLRALEAEGLVEVRVAPMVPAPGLPHAEIVLGLKRVIRGLRAKTLDISGETQLVPIAAARSGVGALTYTYPRGGRCGFTF